MHSGHNNNNSTMVGVSGTSRPLTTSCILPICFPRQTSGKTVRSSGWYRPESTQSFPRCWTRCALRGTTTGRANTWHRQWLSPLDPNAFRLWTHKIRISIINISTMIFGMIYNGFEYYWLGVGRYISMVLENNSFPAGVFGC